MVMKFENLPNEILIDCFEYFHTLELHSSFGQLNHRFNELIRTIPWYLDFQHVHKSMYDVLCQQMLIDPDVQKQVCSLRLSNKDTPGQINDFLSKFSLDQFSHLRSLTFIDLRENNIPQLQAILPKLSQITAVHVLDSNNNQRQLESFIPLNNLVTLSIDSTLFFVERTIPIKHLTLSSLRLNEICRLFPYTPSLEYLKVSCVNERCLGDQYHPSFHPVRLKDLILVNFRSTFNDLTHLLQNMPKLRSLTLGSSKDRNILDADSWEELITSSLPYLKDFRFQLAMNNRYYKRDNLRLFNRFHTTFWLDKYQWYTECSMNKQTFMIYTIPYMTEFIEISSASRRYCNPLINNSQTFKNVKKLIASAGKVLKYSNYYLPNVTSLVLKRSLNASTEHDEELVIESLTKVMNFSNLTHLEIPLNCQISRPSLLFRILELAPQLSSLHTTACFFESLINHPEFNPFLNEKIRKLDLDNCSYYRCQKHLTITSLHQSIPNIEKLTMSLDNIDDFSLLEQFPKLVYFEVQIERNPFYSMLLESQAAKQNVLFDKIESICERSYVTFDFWLGGTPQ